MEMDMTALARIGAQARLQELDAERDSLLTLIGQEAGKSLTVARVNGHRPRRRKKGTRRVGGVGGSAARKMSAAARKAVSERMKKYWAKRRRERAHKNAPQN